MKDEDEKRATQFACQTDLGGGRRVDVEIGVGNQLWIAAGSGIGVVDLWMKEVGPGLDIRVRVLRSEHGLEVSIDRGEQAAPWWPAGNGPRLMFAIDPIGGNASVTAGIGDDQQFQEILLGTIKL